MRTSNVNQFFSQKQTLFLVDRTKKYVWWKTPGEAMKYPHLVLAQIMNWCTWEDYFLLQNTFSHEQLTDVLKNAEIGMFRPQSWNMWWLRLTKCEYEDIPLMPTRNLA